MVMRFKIYEPKYTYPDEFETEADINGFIFFNGINKQLCGSGSSRREKIDGLEQELGNALAAVRAIKDLANDAENYLIKQSCIQPKKDYTMYFDELDKDLVSDYATNFLGQWKSEPVPNAKLKSLVGRWVQRTKPVIYHNGLEDHSFSAEPIFINSANDTCVEFSHKKYDKWESDDHISFLNGKWLDNNWKEYESKLVSNQILKSLVGKWVKRTKSAKRPGGLDDESYMNYPYAFILSVSKDVIRYNQENLGSDVYRFNKKTEPSWFDDNWEELINYKPKKEEK